MIQEIRQTVEEGVHEVTSVTGVTIWSVYGRRWMSRVDNKSDDLCKKGSVDSPNEEGKEIHSRMGL